MSTTIIPPPASSTKLPKATAKPMKPAGARSAPVKNTLQPVAPRRIMIAPGRHVVVSGLRPGQAQPRTKLGQLALQLSQQTAAATLSVTATSAYVYGLIESAAPSITFTDVPPGMTSTLAELQSAYSGFLTQYAVFQGEASAWINTQQNTATASIFSQLVSVPNTLSSINSAVTSNFTLLNSLTPGSAPYNTLLAQQEALIGAESGAVTSLVTQMQTLGTNLENATTTLIASTQPTQVLGQLLAAYATDIATLNTAIDNAHSQISADKQKIAGEGVGAAVSAGVGLVGLLNFWNPVGWFMIAGGAVGAYFAIEEIKALNAKIALLHQQIDTDTNWTVTDQAAASLVSAFCTQLQGFASMSAASEQELVTLQNLYTSLAGDIATAVADLQNNDLTDAQTEWTTILSAAQFLEGLTAYIWPSPTMLSSPSTFAAIGNDLYCIGLSGELYHYSGSSSTWTDLGVTALSCVGQGSTLVAIDGAPVNGTNSSGTASASTYFVKSYNMSSQTWTTLSTFPAAAVAVGGSAIYAINQTATDRQVYQYSGSGTTWTALTALPGPDAAIRIAVAGGTLFALTNNSQFVYQYNSSNSTWTQVGASTPYGTLTCFDIEGNGTKLAMVATNNYLYLYDPTVGGVPANTGSGVIAIAQLTNGNQYQIDTYQNLYVADPATLPAWTFLASNATGVHASDTDQVYYSDNLGNLYSVAASNAITLLPAMPNT